MDRYQKVEKPRREVPIKENEIRINAHGLIKNYINYATSLLRENHLKEIEFKAMGQAISKAIAVVEMVKKRIPMLHQDISISSVSLTDIWEPLEEGLVPVETTRQVSMMTITLSTNELNKNSSGYQAPCHVKEPKQAYYSQKLLPRQALRPYNAVNEDSYNRGRGGCRGTGQGWGRGGFGDYDYQDNGGYAYRGQDGARGRDGMRGRDGCYQGYDRSRGEARSYGYGRGPTGGRHRSDSYKY